MAAARVRTGQRLLIAAGIGMLVTVAGVPATASAAQDPTTCAGSISLENGGFEAPAIGDQTFTFLDEGSVPGWKTTASDRKIELWSDGYKGVPAAEGRQFAELNATEASTLYQDVATSPGQSLRWRLDHRGRLGNDTMEVLIGPPDGPLVPQGRLADAMTWGQHSGQYRVPAGQTRTRFAFRAVESTGGDASFGNFLDGISFGTGPCLITTKSVTNTDRDRRGAAKAGDVLEYSAVVRNGGGDRAKDVVLEDLLPKGTRYAPGSLVVAGQKRTDQAGDDTAEYTGDRVRFRLGSGATASQGGSLSPQEEIRVSFRAEVLDSAAGTTIANTARTTFTDPLDDTAAAGTSNTVKTPVDQADRPHPSPKPSDPAKPTPTASHPAKPTPAASDPARPTPPTAPPTPTPSGSGPAEHKDGALAMTGASIGVAAVALVAVGSVVVGVLLARRRRRTS
ncbi:hypothetical protein ACFVHW_01335 [Streptomyces sp. NPDC127110]|uniref:hypothetical protein n=1 Tax=Streptomyces sp. NPDC127110 TaxID=3345362 RepID=UPI003627D782